MVNIDSGFYYVRGAQVPYNSDFTTENSGLRSKDAYLGMDKLLL
jgi:hypothetical protein